MSETDTGAMVRFIKDKIVEAEKTLRRRLEMQETWAGGTDASWRAVGSVKSKAERLIDSDTHGRIADKNRKELEMLKAIRDHLLDPQPPTPAAGE
jgi:hypothetical protein